MRGWLIGGVLAGCVAAAAAIAVVVVGGGAGAHPRGVAPSTTVVADPAAGDLDATLAAGRRARYAAPLVATATPERRRALVDALAHGALDERRRALAALTLEDRPAADDAARGLLADRALFADAARVLLVRPDGEPTSADVTRVRRALRTGAHDDGSRSAVATLVLDTLVRHRSPDAPRFAATVHR